jgi:N-acetylmuramoyl-L-alanine amidase
MRYIFLFLLFVLLAVTDEQTSLPVIVIDGKRYISLYDMQARFPMEASFDIALQRGKLYHMEHVAAYKVGHSYILADGRLLRDEYPVTRVQGDILLPVYLAGKIIESLYPELSALDNGSSMLISRSEKPAADTSAPPPQTDPIAFIIIDAGHGGKDPGAMSRGGLKEKNITLNVAKYLETALKGKVKNIPVYLSRRTDIFLELHERTEFANSKLKKNTNGIFVSVHVNASISPKISGFETYFLSQNPSNEDARNTAALENNVVILEEKSGRKKKYGEIEYIEARMITTQIQKESSMLAQSIQNALSGKMKPFKSRGVRKADFYVLRGSLMPAVLVEIGFITNDAESKYLRQAVYQKQLADSVGNGIAKFITSYNKMLK